MKFEIVEIPQTSTRGSNASAVATGPPHVKTGEPVHIAWRTFYSGDLPNRKIRKKKNKTAVLSSFIKFGADQMAAPRVVNAIFEDPDDHTDNVPGAKGAGSHVIHYDSSVESDTIVDIELISKSRSNKDIEMLRTALSTAGKSPLLFFASGWINSAAGVLKMTSGIVKATARKEELFNASFGLQCATDVEPLLKPRRLLATRKANELLKGRYIGEASSAAGGYPLLLNASDDTPYAGDEPYVIIEVDQSERPDLAEFESQLRAGALLKDWTPKAGVDVGEVMRIVGDGLKR